MDFHDNIAAGHYDRYLCTWNDGNKISSLSDFQGGTAYTQIYPISGEGSPCCYFWDAGCLLSEKCNDFFGKLWAAGASCYYRDDRTSPLEAPDAAVHSGRNSMLYVAGAVPLLGYAQFLYLRYIRDMV